MSADEEETGPIIRNRRGHYRRELREREKAAARRRPSIAAFYPVALPNAEKATLDRELRRAEDELLPVNGTHLVARAVDATLGLTMMAELGFDLDAIGMIRRDLESIGDGAVIAFISREAKESQR